MSVAKTPRMKHRLLLLSLLLTLLSTSTGGLTTTAQANHEGQDGQPRNSWEQQQETYHKHNYDTYRNGPLPETLEQGRWEERQRDEYSRDQRRENSQDNRRGSSGDSRGNNGGYYGGGYLPDFV